MCDVSDRCSFNSSLRTPCSQANEPSVVKFCHHRAEIQEKERRKKCAEQAEEPSTP